jgi:hypothetical protein
MPKSKILSKLVDDALSMESISRYNYFDKNYLIIMHFVVEVI